MKKLIVLLFSVALMSCEGDTGPPGPPGVNILGSVFDVTVDFTSNNGFSNLIAFPNNIEVFESDVVMVYLLEEQVSDPSGPIDVWTPLPQPFFVDGGAQVVYNFNHTFLDVNLFLDGNVNLNNLGPGFTNNQTFRIAILPADFAEEFDVNLENYNAVMQALQSQNPGIEVQSL
ncbi:hypothetical protein [Flavobacteriaceae bacterium 14752]|uniref:hypothetical protein n=1 Tax=Mesohalobacter salilacus TaxID=2491711 RepID=UPI000F64061B|nr:hypothetical protein EIG84_01370 [Flavobacteriaceae bacterium 14752]